MMCQKSKMKDYLARLLVTSNTLSFVEMTPAKAVKATVNSLPCVEVMPS